MTSQIAVFNQECVAVASDSVVTITNGRNHRTLPSSDKMHDLGDGHRIIILGSGEARFMQLPWSLLISEWRTTLGEPLPTVSAYAESLVAWLLDQRDLITPEAQLARFRWQIGDYFEFVATRVRGRLSDEGLDDVDWADISVQSRVTSTIRSCVRALTDQADLRGIDAAADEEFLAEQEEFLWSTVVDSMDGIPRTIEGDELLMTEIPRLILSKSEPWSFDSTLAFIGYGSDELLPGHQVVDFHCMVNGQMRALWKTPAHVNSGRTSMIVPFAQRDAIDTFVTGYHSDVSWRIHEVIDSLYDAWLADSGDEPTECDEQRRAAHDSVTQALEDLAWDNYISPMLSTIDGLPRTDMARLAEALVGIQALRAASSTDQPGVGGPIDVALVSRAGGVTWLRRKPLALEGSR